MVASTSITQILSEIRKPELMETRHDTTGLKVHAEDNFLRCQRNSPKTTMVVSPSITQIWAKSETRTHKTAARNTFAKSSCWKQFSLISTKLSQNNNGGVPIYYPNFKWNLKTRAHEMETRHDGLKVRAENNFLRIRRNSPKTTMGVSPSITQIFGEIRKPELIKL